MIRAHLKDAAMKGLALNKPLQSTLLAIMSISLLACAGILLGGAGAENQPLRENVDLITDLRPAVLEERQLQALSRPIGSLAGTWRGSHQGISVSIDLDAKIPTIDFNSDGGIPIVSVSAEFSRKGRVVTVGQVACVRSLTHRVQSVSYSDCPLIRQGDVFTLSISNNSLVIKGRDSEILLTRE